MPTDFILPRSEERGKVGRGETIYACQQINFSRSPEREKVAEPTQTLNSSLFLPRSSERGIE
jgi:hypothetical protein